MIEVLFSPYVLLALASVAALWVATLYDQGELDTKYLPLPGPCRICNAPPFTRCDSGLHS